MRKLTTCLALSSALFWVTAIAEEQSDAEHLASVFQSNEMLEVQLEALQKLLLPTLKQNLEMNGVKLSEYSLYNFTKIFSEEFALAFREDMHQASAQVYKDELSEQELKDLSEFLKTPSGKAFSEKLPTITSQLSKAGEVIGSSAGIKAATAIANRLHADEAEAKFTQEEAEKLLSIFPKR